MIERRIRDLRFLLDANRANSRGKLPAMNQLGKWCDDGIIALKYSEQTQREIERCRDPRIKRKSWAHPIVFPMPSTQDERANLDRIRTTIFGDIVTDENKENDVLTVFAARKYGTSQMTGAQEPSRGGFLAPLLRCAES